MVVEAAEAARLAIEIATLQHELRNRIAEAEASRGRVVAAADEERRRIARDLHDGAQQRLVSIGLGLRHIEHRLGGRAPADVVGDLDEPSARSPPRSPSYGPWPAACARRRWTGA